MNKRIVLGLTAFVFSFALTAEAENYDIVIDKNQSLGEAVVWMRYGLELAVYRDENNITVPSRTIEVFPSFSEELYCREKLVSSLSSLRSNSDKGPSLDRIMPYLDFLEKVQREGYMKEYVWMFHRRDDWMKPGGVKFSEFGIWLGSNSPITVPRTGVILRISDKGKNDIVTEEFYEAHDDVSDSSDVIVTSSSVDDFKEAEVVAKKFVNSLNNGNSSSASRLFATSDKLPQEVLVREIRDLAKIARSCKEQKWHFSYVELIVVGSCAAAIVCEDVKRGEPAYDLDPLFMVRQGNGWKVVPGMSNLRYAEVILTESEFGQLEQCQKLFKDRKVELDKSKNNSSEYNDSTIHQEDLEIMYRNFVTELGSGVFARQKEAMKNILPKEEDFKIIFPEKHQKVIDMLPRMNEYFLSDDGVNGIAKEIGARNIKNILTINCRNEKKTYPGVPADMKIFRLYIEYEKDSSGSSSYIYVNNHWVWVRGFEQLCQFVVGE